MGIYCLSYLPLITRRYNSQSYFGSYLNLQGTLKITIVYLCYSFSKPYICIKNRVKMGKHQGLRGDRRQEFATPLGELEHLFNWNIKSNCLS